MSLAPREEILSSVLVHVSKNISLLPHRIITLKLSFPLHVPAHPFIYHTGHAQFAQRLREYISQVLDDANWPTELPDVAVVAPSAMPISPKFSLHHLPTAPKKELMLDSLYAHTRRRITPDTPMVVKLTLAYPPAKPHTFIAHTGHAKYPARLRVFLRKLLEANKWPEDRWPDVRVQYPAPLAAPPPLADVLAAFARQHVWDALPGGTVSVTVDFGTALAVPVLVSHTGPRRFGVALQALLQALLGAQAPQVLLDAVVPARCEILDRVFAYTRAFVWDGLVSAVGLRISYGGGGSERAPFVGSLGDGHELFDERLREYLKVLLEEEQWPEDRLPDVMVMLPASGHVADEGRPGEKTGELLESESET